MATSQTYEIVVLPRLRSEPEPEPNLLKLADKFFALRMKALTNAADAYASRYEVESQDGVAKSLSRLSNNKAVHWVAIRKRSSAEGSTKDPDELSTVLASEWVGLNVLLGPEEGNELSVPSANLDPFPRMTATAVPQSGLIHRPVEHDELHFLINGMYVDPSARGAGLGSKLMHAALDHAKRKAANAQIKLRVSLSVFSHNISARRLYENCGFTILKEQQGRSRPEFVAVHMELNVPAGSLE